MGRFSIFSYLLFLWLVLGTHAQSSFYRRTYYTPLSSSPAHYYSHPGESEFVPLTYGSDLLTEESKRKESSKKYSKKIPYRPYSLEEDETSSERYTSGEYSNEAHAYTSKEHDSHEYTIGTQIRVQHPITVPKKHSSSSSSHIKYSQSHPPSSHKSSSHYQDVNYSSEVPEPKPTPTKKRTHKYTQYFEPDPFHVVPPPKPTLSASSPPSSNYNVYEPEHDDYEPPSSHSKSHSHDRYKGVASKKQIEKYLEDQQKLLDEALKLQLLNSPKYQRLLKSKEHHEHHFEEGEYEDLPIDPPPPPHGSLFRGHFDDTVPFKPSRARRRPQAAELKRSPKPKGPLPPIGPKPKRRFRSALVINV